MAETSSTIAAAMTGARLLHTMLRVRDLELSLCFYQQVLGMRLLRRQEFSVQRFTLAFLGYAAEKDSTVLELTHNWDVTHYSLGEAYGHIAIGVSDVYQTVRALHARGVNILRPAGPLDGLPAEHIAFIEDPDGYRIELIQCDPRGGDTDLAHPRC